MAISDEREAADLVGSRFQSLGYLNQESGGIHVFIFARYRLRDKPDYRVGRPGFSRRIAASEI
jgi:hypothetical protein